jgi:hypothetical protein
VLRHWHHRRSCLLAERVWLELVIADIPRWEQTKVAENC